jgi:hypothetical protein
MASYSTLQTAWARGLAVDPYGDYEDEFRASREELAGGGKPTYLPSEPPPNAAWWAGFDHTTGGTLDLNGAASAPVFRTVPGMQPELGFVDDLGGRAASGIGAQRIDASSPLVPTVEWYMGDTPLDLQPDVQQPSPWLRDGLT